MVAGEQQIGFLESKRHVIGGVAGRCHRFHRPAFAAHDLAVGERNVGTEIHVGGGIEPAGFADMQRPRQPVRALREYLGAGRRLHLGRRRRMIAVGMGDENMGDGFAAHGIEQRRDMGVVVGAGIEDRDLAAADDVAHRTLEGERARIIGDDGAHARRHLARPGRARDRKLLSNGMSSFMRRRTVNTHLCSHNSKPIDTNFALPELDCATNSAMPPWYRHGSLAQSTRRAGETTKE